MNTAYTQDPQKEVRERLRRLQLPDTALRADAPAFLKHLDLNAAKRLLQTVDAWNERGLFDESERFVHDVLLKSPETRSAFFSAEAAMLQRVETTGEDQLFAGPYGLMEFILPVKVRGVHVHLIRSGKFRERPFSDKELGEIAFATGVTKAVVESAAAALPLRSGESLAAFTSLYRHLRDAVAAALEAQLQAAVNAAAPPGDGLAGLGAVAESAAHQFSNLLSVILGYTSLVLAKTDLPEEAISALNRVAEAAQRGRRLTEEILAVARQRHQTDEVFSGLHECVHSATARLQAGGVDLSRVRLELGATHDQVPASPETLSALLQNMLHHALQSVPAGAAISLITRNETQGGVEQIVAEIRSGDGQPPEETPRLIFPVASEPVPLSQKRVKRRLAPSVIWVADDDPAVRDLCERVLTADGHTVAKCETGDSVRKRLEAGEAPDLVIYDFSMPDIDGWEFCSWLRESGRRTPVILISGFSAEHPAIKRAIRLRKVFLLQKPFSFREMADLVTIAMGETLVG